MSYEAAKRRYIDLRHRAYCAAAENLRDHINVPFNLTEITGRADEAWRRQWRPANDREPPNGGWDWPYWRRARQKDPSRFELAVWSGHHLCGMALGKATADAVEIEILEGNPVPDHPLDQAVLAIIIERRLYT